MIIRVEEADDITAVRDVVLAAFAQTPEADLVDQLRRDSDSVISLVAVDGGKILGHILFSKMSAPFRALALAPQASREGWQAVFVLGEPEYYHRFGFDPAQATGFVSPYAGPYFMALALVGALPVSEGKLDHAPAFAALG
jgi:putative acetyltransferase